MLIGTKLSPNWHERHFSIIFSGGGSGWHFLRLHVSTWPITKLHHQLKWYRFRCLVWFQFFFQTTPVLHLGKWRCSPKKGPFWKEDFIFQPSSHQFSGDILVFREVTSQKTCTASQLRSVRIYLFPICSLGYIQKKHRRQKLSQWNRMKPLRFSEDPKEKKTTTKNQKNHGSGRRFPSTELTELPLPLERSNFTSGQSSLWRIAQVKKQEPIRKGFKVVSGSLLVAFEEVLMNLYVYCTGGRAKCYPSSQWTLANFVHCWSVLILYRSCWVLPLMFLEPVVLLIFVWGNWKISFWE